MAESVTASDALVFDSHCHLGLLDDGPPPPACLLLATACDHWPRLLSLATPAWDRWVAAGLHPAWAQQWREGSVAALAALLARPEVVAVGEVGLDDRQGPAAAVQEQVLRQQIGLARQWGKPLVLHGRGRYGRLLELLRQEDAAAVGGILHGFSGSVELARQFIALGFAIGVGPVLLRPGIRRLPQALRQLPPQALVLETDAPLPLTASAGLAPQRLLALLADRLAGLCGLPPAVLVAHHQANCRRILRLLPL